MSVGWADIPGLSTCIGCCSAAWLQSWLQSRLSGADSWKVTADDGTAWQADTDAEAEAAIELAAYIIGRGQDQPGLALPEPCHAEPCRMAHAGGLLRRRA